MTFVVSSNNNNCLRDFTGVLFSAFPGSTVYAHMNVEETAECIRTHRVSAAFIDGAWDAADDFRLLCELRQSKADLPIYMFAGNDQYEEDAMWHEATGYLIRPVSPEELREAVCVQIPSD